MEMLKFIRQDERLTYGWRPRPRLLSPGGAAAAAAAAAPAATAAPFVAPVLALVVLLGVLKLSALVLPALIARVLALSLVSA